MYHVLSLYDCGISVFVERSPLHTRAISIEDTQNSFEKDKIPIIDHLLIIQSFSHTMDWVGIYLKAENCRTVL